MQVMLSGGTHSGNIAAMTPIRTILGGGDIVLVGGYLNRQMFNLVARKEIRNPCRSQREETWRCQFGRNQRGCNSFGL